MNGYTIEDTQHKVSHTLVISIQNSSYPINEELLHQFFDTYGAVEIIRICTVDDCNSVLLQYQSIYSAIAAKHSLQGRCIYPGCCQMDIQFVNVGWNHVIKLIGRNSCKFENNISDLENTPTTDIISENLKLEENGLFAPAVFDEMLDSDNNDYSMDELAQYDDYEDDDQGANNSSFIIDDGTVIWTIPDTISSVGESDVSSVNLLMEGISNCDPNIENNTCISEIKLSNLAVTSSISSVAKFDLSELEEKHFHTPEVLDKLSNRENDNYPIANKVLYDDYGVDDQIVEDVKLNAKFVIYITYGLDNWEGATLPASSTQSLSFAATIDQLSYLTLELLLIKGLIPKACMPSFLIEFNNSFIKIPPLPPDVHTADELDNEVQQVAQWDHTNFMLHHTGKQADVALLRKMELISMVALLHFNGFMCDRLFDPGIPQKILDYLQIDSCSYLVKPWSESLTRENSVYRFILGKQLLMLVANFDEPISKSYCTWNTIEFGSLSNKTKSNFQPGFFILLGHEKYLGIQSRTSIQPGSDTQRLQKPCLSMAIVSFDGSLSKKQWNPGIFIEIIVDSTITAVNRNHFKSWVASLRWLKLGTGFNLVDTYQVKLGSSLLKYYNFIHVMGNQQGALDPWVSIMMVDQASLGSYAKRYDAHLELKVVYSGLFAAFWKSISTSEIEEGNNNSGALAEKLSSFMELVSSLPHILVNFEPTLFWFKMLQVTNKSKIDKSLGGLTLNGGAYGHLWDPGIDYKFISKCMSTWLPCFILCL